jgi:hypothetical protein
VRHQALAAALAVAFVGVALASGSSYRRGAAIGAGVASLTALASLLAMGRSARRAGHQMKGALLVMVVAFLVRLVLVAVGAALVSRGGESVVAFIVAFFVPYFAFSGVEAAYLHSLRHTSGRNA